MCGVTPPRFNTLWSWMLLILWTSYNISRGSVNGAFSDRKERLSGHDTLEEATRDLVLWQVSCFRGRNDHHMTLICRLKRVGDSHHLVTTRPLFSGWSLIISQARIQDEAQVDNALQNSSNKLLRGNDRTKPTTVKHKPVLSASYESSSHVTLKRFNHMFDLRRNGTNSAFCLCSNIIPFLSFWK